MVDFIRMIEKNERHLANVCNPQLNSANAYYLETGANCQNTFKYSCVLLVCSLVVLALSEHVNADLNITFVQFD